MTRGGWRLGIIWRTAGQWGQPAPAHPGALTRAHSGSVLHSPRLTINSERESWVCGRRRWDIWERWDEWRESGSGQAFEWPPSLHNQIISSKFSGVMFNLFSIIQWKDTQTIFRFMFKTIKAFLELKMIVFFRTNCIFHFFFEVIECFPICSICPAVLNKYKIPINQFCNQCHVPTTEFSPNAKCYHHKRRNTLIFF